MDKLIPGTHIYWAEYRCDCCGELPPDFDIENKNYWLLFGCFEDIRRAYGSPIYISRGYSCSKHQLFIYLSLVLKKYKSLSDETIIRIINDSSMTPFSVHLFGLALDLVPPKEDIPEIVKIAKRVKPKLRIGWKAYQGNQRPHIHIDLGYLMNPRYSKHLREEAEW